MVESGAIFSKGEFISYSQISHKSKGIYTLWMLAKKIFFHKEITTGISVCFWFEFKSKAFAGFCLRYAYTYIRKYTYKNTAITLILILRLVNPHNYILDYVFRRTEQR